MSDIQQVQKPTTKTSIKAKNDKDTRAKPQQNVDNTATHSSTLAPEDLLNGELGEILKPTPSGMLGHEGSTFLQPSSTSSRAGTQVAASSTRSPSFAGKNFASVPTHNTVQAKLTVGAAHDPYEEEADQVAEQVMRMPTSTFSAPAGVGESDDEEQSGAVLERLTDEESELQTKRVSAAASFEMGSDFESQVAATRGDGSPLPDQVRSFMEPRFGADFSGVRVHADGEAANLNQQVSAQAFTLGNDIYLGEGKTDLSSSSGKQLLAHELTHVMQQGAAGQLQRTPADDEDDLIQDNTQPSSPEVASTANTGAAPQTQKQPATGAAPSVAPQSKPDQTFKSSGQVVPAEEHFKPTGPAQQEKTTSPTAAATPSQVMPAAPSNAAAAVKATAAPQEQKQPGTESQVSAGATPSTAPQSKSAQQSTGSAAPAQEHPQTAAPVQQGKTADATSVAQPAQDMAATPSNEKDQTAQGAQAQPMSNPQTAQTDQTSTTDPAKPSAQPEAQKAQPDKPAQLDQSQDKQSDKKAKKLTATKDHKSGSPTAKLEQAEPDAPTAKTKGPTQAAGEIQPALADQPLQIDSGIIEETQSRAEEAQTQQVESAQLVQQTTTELNELNGVEAIIPESLWQELKLDQRPGLDLQQPPIETKSPTTDKADAIIQRTPDPILQRKPGEAPQAAPQQISIPTITLDTTPISTAATTAQAGVGFDTKLAELQTAVTTAKETVSQFGADSLARLEAQLQTTLTQLDTDAQTAKDNITAKFDTANQALDTLQQGLPARVEAIIQAGCSKIDNAVNEYANKCEPDAAAAVQAYCNQQRATPDDGTIPPFGPGEESGYHAKKADAALSAAKAVGRAYADEYRKQGEDTKGTFRGQMRADLTQTMENEITGMRTTLTSAKDSALTDVDTTKAQLVQQANDLYTQSVTTLNEAITSTLNDLTDYETQLTTELTNTQNSFEQQMQAESSKAIAQAQAALSSAQGALAAAIRSATGPDKLLKPGAQAAIDKAAVDIQAQLNQQVSEAANQITQQGTQMSTTVAGIDVQTGSNAYVTTFETTTNSMLDQVITGGLVVINTNMVDFGTQLTTQSETAFNSYVTAATNSLQQIETASQTNLPNFVDSQFKPGLAQAHQKLPGQAQSEGEKAGEAVQPGWKAWAKAIVSIVVGIIVAVAIVAIVAATGGVAGILLGVLAGALIGAAGGAIKCIANNLIDGKPFDANFKDTLIREMATGALSGALQGLTAGVLGVAFQGSLTAGQMVLKEGIDAAAGGLRDGVSDILSQGMQYGWDKIDWGAVGVKALEGFVINAVTAGIFKGKGILSQARKEADAAAAAVSQVDNGLKEVADEVPVNTGWARTPRTASEVKAEALGWPEPEPGYRWNMSKSGVPYQQRISVADGLPEPPKFTLPEGPVQMPLGLPGISMVKPNPGQVLGDIPVTSAPSTLPGQMKLPFMPYLGNPNNTVWQNLQYAAGNVKYAFGNQPWYPTQWSWAAAGKAAAAQLPPRTTKESLKQGNYLLADYQDWWTSSKEMTKNSHPKQYVAPGVNVSDPSLLPGSSSASGGVPNWNVPVPGAPYYNPKDWNFQTNQSATPILPPEAINQFDFGAGFDPSELEEDISTKKP